MVVTLKYRDYKPVVTKIKAVSTPGRKKYASFRVCTALAEGIMHCVCQFRRRVLGKALCIWYGVQVGTVAMPQELTMARVQGGLGVNIVSTSWGVMTDKDALLKRLGGEILVSVY